MFSSINIAQINLINKYKKAVLIKKAKKKIKTS